MNKFEEFRTALIEAGFEDRDYTTYCIFEGDDTPEYEGGWREALYNLNEFSLSLYINNRRVNFGVDEAIDEDLITLSTSLCQDNNQLILESYCDTITFQFNEQTGKFTKVGE